MRLKSLALMGTTVIFIGSAGMAAAMTPQSPHAASMHDQDTRAKNADAHDQKMQDLKDRHETAKKEAEARHKKAHARWVARHEAKQKKAKDRHEMAKAKTAHEHELAKAGKGHKLARHLTAEQRKTAQLNRKQYLMHRKLMAKLHHERAEHRARLADKS